MAVDIEKIFPNFHDIPINSISSAISGEGQEKVVYLLIVGNQSLIQPFLDDTEDKAKLKTVTTAQREHNKLNYDLVLDFYFYFRRGKGSFKIIFQATYPEIQKQYLQALEEVDSLRFIIVNEQKELKKIFDVDWYYYKNRKVLDKVRTFNNLGK